MAISTERIERAPWFRSPWLLVFVYVALIFTFSAQPGLSVPGTFEYKDKVAHTLEYGGLGVLVYRAAASTWPAAPAARRMLLAVLAISLLGALDEKFQAFIPGRDSTIYDWMADTLGATLSQFAGRWLARRGGSA